MHGRAALTERRHQRSIHCDDIAGILDGDVRITERTIFSEFGFDVFLATDQRQMDIVNLFQEGYTGRIRTSKK